MCHSFTGQQEGSKAATNRVPDPNERDARPRGGIHSHRCRRAQQSDAGEGKHDIGNMIYFRK